MNIEKLIEEGELVFLAYVGIITQPLITSMIDSLEKLDEMKDCINFSHRLYVVFIEMAQNIMNYMEKEDYKAFIAIGRDKNSEHYYVLSKNTVTAKAKEKIEKILNEILMIDRTEIKKLYREKRRSGRDAHSKGAGIGFLEIAKISKNIEFEFKPMKNGKYIFSLKVNV